MHRDLDSLEGREFDLVIVGAGINGAAAARQAALEGLKVAILDKGDFGGATSANSLKVIHGGFRYLQSGDLPRLRMSQRETAALLGLAPNLVHPLACLLPTRGHLTRSRQALGLALGLNALLGWDLGRQLSPERRLPKGRLLGRAQVARLFPALGHQGFSGGAIWHDAQVEDSERLTLCFILDAVARGAQAANYLEAVGLARGNQGQVAAVLARDAFSGRELEIKTRAVLNAAGPWTASLGGRPLPGPALAQAFNLVIDRPLAQVAVGLQARTPKAQDPVCGGFRFLFLAPWRGRTLAGTSYKPYAGDPSQARATAPDLRALLEEFNAACPGLGLKPGLVSFFHHGLLPLDRPGQPPAGGGLASHHRVLDHGAAGGARGLYSLVGVKYTTARAAAHEALHHMRRQGDLPPGQPVRQQPPLPGAQLPAGADLEALANLGEEARASLVRHYGDQAGLVAALALAEPALAQPLAPGCDILGCQVAWAARQEMAQTLADLALRRTDLGKAGQPAPEALAAACAILARELGWDQARQGREIARTRAVYDVIEELHAQEERP